MKQKKLIILDHLVIEISYLVGSVGNTGNKKNWKLLLATISRTRSLKHIFNFLNKIMVIHEYFVLLLDLLNQFHDICFLYDGFSSYSERARRKGVL